MPFDGQDISPQLSDSKVRDNTAIALTPGGNNCMISPRDFEFGEELGGSLMSEVLEATHKHSATKYAIKVLNKAQLVKRKKVNSATVEKDALIRLSMNHHPGIILLHAVFQDPTSLYYVLSFAPNGDLNDLIGKCGSFSPSCARFYTAQIVDAVQWVHSQGVLHRDLKPENILLDADMRVKLPDFGSAYISKDLDLSSRTSTFVGTAAYISPELLSATLRSTSKSSDLWGIGCILYFLLAGQSPFMAATDYLSMQKIKTLDYTFPQGFNSDGTNLVRRLLVLEPLDRLGVEPKSSTSELRYHPFFTGYPDDPRKLPTDSVKWDTLWTDPPPVIECGLIPAPPIEQQEFSWDIVI